jgi:hypothetical protein
MDCLGSVWNFWIICRSRCRFVPNLPPAIVRQVWRRDCSCVIVIVLVVLATCCGVLSFFGCSPRCPCVSSTKNVSRKRKDGHANRYPASLRLGLTVSRSLPWKNVVQYNRTLTQKKSFEIGFSACTPRNIPIILPFVLDKEIKLDLDQTWQTWVDGVLWK